MSDFLHYSPWSQQTTSSGNQNRSTFSAISLAVRLTRRKSKSHSLRHSDLIHPNLHPFRFFIELIFHIERSESLISFQGIELHSALHLSEADRAKMHGGGIHFVEVIRPVHIALIVDAVTDAKHVPCFVSENFCGSSQHS